MTAGAFREVDQDLLADYLGGALDGTPDAAVVARLVAEDAAWAEAYALLAPAVADVRADLAAWGASPPQLPAAVADRIVAALADASLTGPAPLDLSPADPALVDVARAASHSAHAERTDLDRADTERADAERANADRTDAERANAKRADAERTDAQPATVEPRSGSGMGGLLVPAQPHAGTRRRSTTPRPTEPGPGSTTTRPDRGSATGPDRIGTTGPGRRRRRWSRLAGPVALAAASIAAIGLGVGQLAGRETSAGDSAVTGQAAPEAAASPGAAPFRTLGPAQRSGTDYTPESLARPEASAVARQFASGGPAPASRPGEQTDSGRVADPGVGLDRLTEPAALASCLAGITAEHGVGPLSVEVVDYAWFQGQPALVVRFTDAAGARWAWASGPECGVPGSGADTRHRARVG